MAISVLQNPGYYEPVGKDLMFISDSTNNTNINFKYVFDIYVEGLLISRILQNPNPALIGIVNIAEVVRTQLSIDLTIDTSPTPVWECPAGSGGGGTTTLWDKNSGEMVKEVCVKFGESYSLTATDPAVIYPDLVEKCMFVFNGTYPANLAFADFSLNLYALGSCGRVLSDQTYAMISRQNENPGVDIAQESLIGANSYFLSRVNSEDFHTLSVISDSGSYMLGNSLVDCLITICETNGTLTTYVDTMSPVPAGNVSNTRKLMYLGCGPANIAKAQGLILDPTKQPATLLGNLAWYSITFRDNTTFGLTKPYVFVWDEDTCRGQSNYSQDQSNSRPVRLAWINSRGGYDYFNFDKPSLTENNVSRKPYRKLRGNYASANDVKDFTYDSWDRGKADTQVYPVKTMVLRTRFLQEWEFILLSFLVKSPAVFLAQNFDHFLNGTNSNKLEWIAVSVTDKKFTNQRSGTGKPKQATIKIEISNVDFTPIT